MRDIRMRDIKICGLSDATAIDAACDAGATRVGLVFFPPSPRSVSLEVAAKLADRARGRSRIVALTVDPDDALIDAIVAAVAPDDIQLHGHESPDRTAALKARTGCGIIKAVGISNAQDVAGAAGYRGIVDCILYDAKPQPGVDRPGGNGLTFDWQVLRGVPAGEHYLLSGGLTPENVATALALTGAPGVDVSSGVESAPGRKDLGKIRSFVAAVRAFDAADASDDRSTREREDHGTTAR